jgi:hypothetical protein
MKLLPVFADGSVESNLELSTLWAPTYFPLDVFCASRSGIDFTGILLRVPFSFHTCLEVSLPAGKGVLGCPLV